MTLRILNGNHYKRKHNCRGGRGDLFYYDIFQFGRCAKTVDSVDGGGVPYFIMIYSRLEGVKNGAPVEGAGCLLLL